MSAVVTSNLPDVLCGYHLALVRPGPHCDGAFVARAFSAIGPRDQFQVAANGITRFGLGGDAIRTGLFATPPAEEQRAIAAFLDRETGRIDVLVEKKERLIAFLQEKRAALITRAVTKGLDPNIPMKDSGVKWLGEIPVHWEVKRLKFLLSRNDGGVWGDEPDNGPDDRIVLRSTEQSVGGSWQIDDPAIRRLTPEEFRKAKIEVGDLVITKSSGSELHIGKTSIVDQRVEALACAFSNFMQRLRPAAAAIGRFLFYVLNSAEGREQMSYLSSTTTGLGNLSGELLDQIVLGVPPVGDQIAITSFLDRETARMDALIEKIRQSIERLREYRMALISAAVTGKIDVRGAALR